MATNTIVEEPKKLTHNEMLKQGYITSEELAFEWNTDKYELCNFRNKGMPFEKVNNSYYYKLEDCQRWWRGEV